MNESQELDQSIKDALDKFLECAVALVKAAYAKGRRDEYEGQMEAIITKHLAKITKQPLH